MYNYSIYYFFFYSLSSLFICSLIKKKYDIDAYIHTFYDSNGSKGYNIFLSSLSRRSQGLESILLTTQYDDIYNDHDMESQSHYTYGFTMAIAFINLLDHVDYKSKDVLLLISPESFGHLGIESFIEDYFNTSPLKEQFSSQASTSINDSLAFEYASHRYSHIYASIHLDILRTNNDHFRDFAFQLEGNLPDLDLMNIAVTFSRYFGVHNIGLSPSIFLSKFPDLYHSVYNFLRSNGVSHERIVLCDQLFTFILNNALFVPSNAHFYPSKYRIQSMTVTTKTPQNIHLQQEVLSEKHQGQAHLFHMIRLFKILELTLRSIHYLAEPLHQSYYFYLLISPHHFIPIIHYMIVLGLLMSGTFLYTAFYLINSKVVSVTRGLLKYSYFIGFGVFMLLYPTFVESIRIIEHYSTFLQDIRIYLTQYPFEILASLYIAYIIILKRCKIVKSEQEKDMDYILRLLSIILLCIYIFTISFINFSLALITTILAIPFFNLFLLRRHFRVIQLLAMILSSPFVILYILSNVFEYNNANELYKKIYDMHQFYGSYLYIFMTLVYTPMNMLGIELALSQ